jgi:hypothetical protein
MDLTIYVPRDGVAVPGLSRPGHAALVAIGRRAGQIDLAVCERATMQGHRDICFADRCREAAWLLIRKARPQGTRLVKMAVDDLVPVGFWNEQQGRAIILPGRERDLHRWLGSAAHRNDLEATDSAHNARMDGRRKMRNAFIQGRPDEGMRLMQKHGLRHW